MRVSTQMYPQQLLGQLGKLSEQQQKLQNQVATGLRVQEAADDPSAARKIIMWQADKAAIDQYRENVHSQRDLAITNAGVIQQLKKLSDRANELTIVADGTQSKDALQHYAKEVDGLIEQAFSLGNSRFNGNYIFAGTATDTAAFEATRDATGKIIDVTSQGNSNVSSVEVSPGNTLSAQWVGSNLNGGGQIGLFRDSSQEIDVFGDLIALRDHLMNGDTESIQQIDNDKLEAVEDHFIRFAGLNGSLQARMETQIASLNNQEFALTGMISREGDADLAETVVRLNEVQYAYQAALQTGAKIMDRSLMDYLR